MRDRVLTPVCFGPDDPSNYAVGAFVSNIIWGDPNCLDNYCSMGVFDNGMLVAGTVYHNFHPDTGVIELTSATTTAKWLERPVIKEMFNIPFNMIGARLCALRVSEHNTRMRKIANRFGFQETVIPRLRGEDEAECIYTISAYDWANHKLGK